ncbi:MAG TPA: hypothetical protein VGN07_23780 [Steroidobacteraceae bacterium]|jgi:hypothetical protein
MEMCYVYGGIGQVIMEMTASDWAAWFSAGGTVLAVASAVWLYWRGRADAKNDLAARRRVLHAMLRQHVIAATKFVADAHDRIRRAQADLAGLDLQIHVMGFALPDADRLMELQADLISFGEDGDDDIAAFIESCRQYHATQSGWHAHIRHGGEHFVVDGKPVVLVGIENALNKLSATSGAAYVAIKRFDKR